MRKPRLYTVLHSERTTVNGERYVINNELKDKDKVQYIPSEHTVIRL